MLWPRRQGLQKHLKFTLSSYNATSNDPWAKLGYALEAAVAKHWHLTFAFHPTSMPLARQGPTFRIGLQKMGVHLSVFVRITLALDPTNAA